MNNFTGIYDTSNGSCDAALSIAGEGFKCQLNPKHEGWAHQNFDAEAIWDGPR